MRIIALLASASVFLSSQSRAQYWKPGKEPPFHRYAVPDTFTAPPSPVDLRSHPEASRFGTLLRETARKGPNFAGHFTITYWNCGHMDCATLAIIDARTERVYFAPFDIESDIHYQRWSRLLLVDPRISYVSADKVPGPRIQYWYVWDDRKLAMLDSVPMQPIPQR